MQDRWGITHYSFSNGLTTAVFKVQRRLVRKNYLFTKRNYFSQVFLRCLSPEGVKSLKIHAFQKLEAHPPLKIRGLQLDIVRGTENDIYCCFWTPHWVQ